MADSSSLCLDLPAAKVITPLPTFTSIFEGLLDRISSSSSGADWPGKGDVQSLIRAQPKLSTLLSKDWRQQLLGDDRKDEKDEDWSLCGCRLACADPERPRR